MAGVLSRFYFATATTILLQQLKNSSNNRNTVKSTALWLPVWKTEWCLNKGIAKEIKITSKKTDMVKPRKRRFHFIESDSDTD